MLTDIMLSDIKLSNIMLSDIKMNAVMVSDIMLSVVKMNAAMLSVVASFNHLMGGHVLIANAEITPQRFTA
jgi:hypothetical protein